MNSILRVYAYRNALKKPAGPFYYLRALSLGRLDIGDIIARISRLPFAISPQGYALLVTIFLDECIAATAEGYHIATPQMRWSPAKPPPKSPSRPVAKQCPKPVAGRQVARVSVPRVSVPRKPPLRKSVLQELEPRRPVIRKAVPPKAALKVARSPTVIRGQPRAAGSSSVGFNPFEKSGLPLS